MKVVEISQCEWEDQKHSDPIIQAFLKEKFPPKIPLFEHIKGTVTDDHVRQAILNGSLFGLVQCDVHVPPHLEDTFGEFQPIFKQALVGREDIGDFMRTYAEKNNLLSQPRQTLVASYHGKQLLLITSLLKWYIEHGLIVDNISQIVEYTPKRCFHAFGEKVTEARREGDKDANKAILAETMKLVRNASYGKCGSRVDRYKHVAYVDNDTADILVNEARFRKLTPLSDSINEVEMAKSTVRWSLPYTVAVTVYQEAKLHMLRFVYDFLQRFLPQENYHLNQTDTDSIYLSLATPSLEEAVKPNMREEFYQTYHEWFPAKRCDAHHQLYVDTCMQNKTWNPFPCCSERTKFDKRTPGLFKTEYEGDGIIALCSKTYYCFGDNGPKVSCKGLNKNSNMITKAKYLDVLKTGISGGGVNKGFRTDGTSMLSYTQQRNSLSYFYIKRRVMADGVTTAPTLV